MSAHTPADLERIEAYRIRRTVAVDALFGLRTPGGPIDATAVAIEATMRDRAGLPSWIRELDAPPEFRSTLPWPYCPHPDSCPECTTALAAGLPREQQRPSWLSRALNAIAAFIDDTTARVIRGGR